MSGEWRILILETSGRVGRVALARGEQVLAERRLDEARRHARDLVPAIRDLLAGQGWRPKDLEALIAGRGPGSYTGLRVGLMTAKTLTYAIGCPLLGIDTFAAIALQAPEGATRIDVLADAQQDKVYVQKFHRDGPTEPWQPLSALAIWPFADWLAGLEKDTWISGPGVRGKEDRLQDRLLVEKSAREPYASSLLSLGLERLQRGERDDFWTLEPLYLRPSAAEEQWRKKLK